MRIPEQLLRSSILNYDPVSHKYNTVSHFPGTTSQAAIFAVFPYQSSQQFYHFTGEETSPHVYIFYRFTTYTKSGNGVHMAPLPLFNIPIPAFAQIHPLAGACQTHIPVLYHSQAFPDSQAAELSQRPPQLTFSRAGL